MRQAGPDKGARSRLQNCLDNLPAIEMWRQEGAMTINRIAVLTLVGLLLTASAAEAQPAYEGQIDGDFEGWTGETIYKLMDGHIIQQSEYHYHYHYAFSPRVIIYQSGGGYKIHVEDDDDQDIRIRILK
jgi:hypothetical protein